MYSKKRTLNATASSSVNKKKKNAEVPETSTNKKIVSATEKIKVLVTTSLIRLPLRLLKSSGSHVFCQKIKGSC